MPSQQPSPTHDVADVIVYVYPIVVSLAAAVVGDVNASNRKSRRDNLGEGKNPNPHSISFPFFFSFKICFSFTWRGYSYPEANAHTGPTMPRWTHTRHASDVAVAPRVTPPPAGETACPQAADVGNHCRSTYKSSHVAESTGR
jgi:hypothetical protein